MSKRFVDSEMFDKDFFAELSKEHKLLWLYIICTASKGGIWRPKKRLDHIRLGYKVDYDKALEAFNQGEVRVVPINDGKCWYLPDFVSFQYGKLPVGSKIRVGIKRDWEENNLVNDFRNEFIDNIMSNDSASIGYEEPINRTNNKDKDIVIDKEIIKDKDKEKKELIKKVVDSYNEICISLPKCTKVSDARKSSILCRISDMGGYDKVVEMFQKTEASDFLTGRKTDFKASFDWLICCKGNWIKVMEGNYDNNNVHSNLEIGRVLRNGQENELLKKAGF